LKREQAAYNVQFATTRAQIEQLKKIGDDTSKTFGERTNAIKKAGALEQSINAKNLDFISREIDLTQKRINLKGTENITDEDRQKVYDLQLKKAELINDTAGKSTEIQNTLNGLLKEQKDLLSGISESLIKIGREYNLVTEKEEFEFVKAKQIEQLELFIKQLKDVGKTLGKDVTGQIKIAQQAIDGLNSRDFTSTFKPISQLARDLRPASQEIKILEKRLKDLQDININFGVDNTVTQEKIKKQIEKLTKGGLKSENVLKIQFPDIKIIGSEDVKFYDDFLNGIEDFEGLLQKTLDEIFGDVDGEKAKEFLKGVASLVGEFGNLLNEATDIQLSNIDKQLDKLSERRETLQDELSRELELQEKGLANNVGNKQAEVDGLLAEEARLMAEKEKIQKEAQKRQLISDTIAQGQSLITSQYQHNKRVFKYSDSWFTFRNCGSGCAVGVLCKN
jgi:hypothetical protein